MYFRFMNDVMFSHINQSINQKLFITHTASCTELESEVQAVTSGRVLRMVIERVVLDLKRLLKVFSVPDSRMVSGISFHTVGAACR